MQQKSWEEVKLSVRAGDTDARNLALSPVLDVFEELKLKDLVAPYNAAHPSAGLEIRGRSGLRMPVQLIRSFYEKVFLRI